MVVKKIPDGYHTITPILVNDDADRVLEFMKKVLGAAEVFMSRRPDGKIWHAEVQIGDSRLMMGDSKEDAPARKTALSLYVDDVDATYKLALASGAKSVREPADQFYGDRSAGVEDAAGNSWWLSTHVEDVSPEELEKRMKAMEGQH